MQFGRAMLFLALLGISMVPLIVAPPEKEEEVQTPATTTVFEGMTEDTGDYVTPSYQMKKRYERLQAAKYQQALDKMYAQATTSRETVDVRTDRLLKEALQLLEEVQPYQKRFWLEVFAYFLQNMLNTVKQEKIYVRKINLQLGDEYIDSTANRVQQRSPPIPRLPQEIPLKTSESTPDHTVPETTQHQTVQATSEEGTTLPKKDQHIPTHDVEEDTTTAPIPNKYENPLDKVEEDELVHELQELHKLPARERMHQLQREIENERQRQIDSQHVLSTLDPERELRREIESERQREIDSQHVLSTLDPERELRHEIENERQRDIDSQHVLSTLDPEHELRQEIESERQYEIDSQQRELRHEIERERQREIDSQHVLSTPDPERELLHDIERALEHELVRERQREIDIQHALSTPTLAREMQRKITHESDIENTHVLNTLTPERELQREHEIESQHILSTPNPERETDSEGTHNTPTPIGNSFVPSTPATAVKRSSYMSDYQPAEMDEQHRSGAKQEEIDEALGVNRHELPNGLKLVTIDKDAEIHKVQDSTADDGSYKTNPNTWKPYASPYPPKPYTNNSFNGMHIHMPPRDIMHKVEGRYYRVPYNPKMRTDPRNIQNTLHKLQRENYLLKTRLMSYTQPNGNMHKIRGATFPGPNRMSQFLPHEARYPAEYTLAKNVQNPVGTPIRPPYPYIANSDLKNVTLQGDIGKTNPLVSKTSPPNVNSEFTDEMKRELSDGKVIVLSDSVVRSNFEPENTKDKGKETKVATPEVGEAGVQAPKLVSG